MIDNKAVEMIAMLANECMARQVIIDDMAHALTEEQSNTEAAREAAADREFSLRHLESQVDDLKAEVRDLRDLKPTPTEEQTRREGEQEYKIRSLKGQVQALHALLFQDEVVQKLRTYLTGQGVKDRGNKIRVIKNVREITSWGLKESKDFVEAYTWPPVEILP